MAETGLTPSHRPPALHLQPPPQCRFTVPQGDSVAGNTPGVGGNEDIGGAGGFFMRNSQGVEDTGDNVFKLPSRYTDHVSFIPENRPVTQGKAAILIPDTPRPRPTRAGAVTLSECAAKLQQNTILQGNNATAPSNTNRLTIIADPDAVSGSDVNIDVPRKTSLKSTRSFRDIPDKVYVL